MIQIDSQIMQSFSVIVRLDRVQVTASYSSFRVLATGIHKRYHYGRKSGLSSYYDTAPSFCSELTMPIRVFDVILALWAIEDKPGY